MGWVGRLEGKGIGEAKKGSLGGGKRGVGKDKELNAKFELGQTNSTSEKNGRTEYAGKGGRDWWGRHITTDTWDSG